MSIKRVSTPLFTGVVLFGATLLLVESCSAEKHSSASTLSSVNTPAASSPFTTDNTTLEAVASDIPESNGAITTVGHFLLPLAEEIGLMGLQRWHADVGALESNVPDNGSYRFWTGDNALMLWALSKTDYAYLRSLGWGVKLRDYLIDTSFDKGQFTEGIRLDPNTGALSKPTAFKACSPAMETQVLWGIIAYTMAFPDEKGRRTIDAYHQFINEALRDQHQRIIAGQKGQTCATGPGTNHDFTAAATIAYHILNLNLWAGVEGRKEFKTLAADAWKILVKKQNNKHLFAPSILRNAQILFALTRANAAGAQLPGLREAKEALANAVRVDQAGHVDFIGLTSADEAGTQALAYLLISSAEPGAINQAFLANRMCNGKGVFWMGVGGANSAGPVEALAMGMVAAAHMRQKGWQTTTAPCMPSP